MNVGAYLIGILLDLLTNDLLHRLLKARRTGTANHSTEKCYAILIHTNLYFRINKEGAAG
jgi:hypothetical protein